MKIFKLGKISKPRPTALSGTNYLYTPLRFSNFSSTQNESESPVFILDGLEQEQSEIPNIPFYPVFPVKNPLFPLSSYFTRISPAQQDLLKKMKVKYVTAFLSKEAVSKDHRSNAETIETLDHEYIQEENPAEEVSSEEPTQKKRGRGRPKTPKYEQLNFLSPTGSNGLIIYDENIRVGYGQHLEDDGTGKLVVKEDPKAFDIQEINSPNDLFQIGTLCRITTQRLPSEDPTKQDECFAVLKSLSRVRIEKEIKNIEHLRGYYLKENKPEKPAQNPFFFFRSSPLPEETPAPTEIEKAADEIFKSFVENFKFVKVEHYLKEGMLTEKEFNDAYKSKITQLLSFYFKLKSKVQINVPELLVSPEDTKSLEIICGFLSATTLFSKIELQHLLQTIPIKQRLDLCLKYFLKYEKQFFKEWNSLEKSSTLPMDPQTQREQFVNIYNFLKKSSENPFKKPIIEKIKSNMIGKKFPPELAKQIEDELSRFTELHESHPDYNVYRSYLELVTSLPFGVKSPDNFDIKNAKAILDEDHYGMDEVKTRILEFIAVAKLKGSIKGKSLLLVGPPGVGKTSIGSSIAKCLGRKFIRIALGGEHDVSVLKGHRKTYVGAYPGRIIQALKTAETDNPVILLDEIDKISSGMRGNLQDTLLEILDPVQNSNFTDNYLDTPIDLSNVLFVCTANLLETIHPAVLDRMEVIQLSGYTKEEKQQIMLKYLFPKAMDAAGLKEKYSDHVGFTDAAVDSLLVNYAREAGVRGLERLVKRICEKITLEFVKGNVSKITIVPESLKKYVGLPRFGDQKLYPEIPPPGIIMGLAYNSYGGSIIYIETIKANTDSGTVDANGKKVPRKGMLKLTGQLGDVMQESVQIAYSYAKYVLSSFFQNDFLEVNDVHIHFPDGASKKDGPSAGIAITSSVISLALNHSVEKPTAMTGEISLTGKVLKIGGVKEKLLAAKRENINRVIFPLSNKPDVDELKDYIKEGVEFHFAENYFDVMKILFPSKVPEQPAQKKTLKRAGANHISACKDI